jgi:hypothetical protein
MDKLTALLGAILALGGGTGLVGIVWAVRLWKRGAIEDDNSIIARLNEDSKAQRERANAAEGREQVVIRERNQIMEQAIRYRLQIIALGAEPLDMDIMKKELGR